MLCHEFANNIRPTAAFQHFVSPHKRNPAEKKLEKMRNTINKYYMIFDE